MPELRPTTIHGYADRLSVAPGERIELKVSCEEPGRYRADVVRLIHGDTNPAGPGFKEEVLDTEASGEYDGRFQATDAGSCVVVEDGGALALSGPFTLHAFVMPTTPGKDGQAIMGRYAAATETGYALTIENGALALRLGGGGKTATISLAEPFYPWCWYSVAATYNPESGRATLYSKAVVNSVNSLLSPIVPVSGEGFLRRSVDAAAGDSGTPFTIAGLSREAGSPWVDSHFNGKIDSPRVWSRVLSRAQLDALATGKRPSKVRLVAAWDFADGIGPDGIPGDSVTDRGPNGLHGTCVNFPARGMTGWNWEGIEERFVHAPGQYGAIHFHDDDLEDCRWDTDIDWTVPDDLRGGVYALRLQLGEAEDWVPFFVLPPRGQATAKALFLVPTASYLAYANQHTIYDMAPGQAVLGHTSAISELDFRFYGRAECGLSCYDEHSDGSGVHSSSALRPIITMRPKFRIAQGAPWQFPADLHLVDWLDAMGFEYDVATDRELHDEGADLLRRYNVVFTGSHPEYYSTRMLDAWEEYLAGGGRAMYLGSNGFYWIIAWHPEKPHLMEVRRAELGSRAWQARAGEYYMQLNGERSGLWRGRGRAPQKVFGTGFTAEGFDHSSYYVQMPDARDPSVAFIMEGISADEKIGDFGLVGGGAAGYEIDRYDLLLGTPPHARLLAYSEGHSDNYPHVVEEIFFNYPHLGGTMDYQVRADITYFSTRNGGAVFSTSSISWCGSLSHNGYENNVSRMTANVLRRFLDPEPLPPLD
jgi:N,N-dimethylformamidase